MPTTFDFNIGFVHFQRIEGLSILLFPEPIEDFTVFLDPVINRSVTNIYSTIIEQVLNFTIAQIVAQVVTNSDNNYIFLELFAFERIYLPVSLSFFLHFTLNLGN